MTPTFGRAAQLGGANTPNTLIDHKLADNAVDGLL